MKITQFWDRFYHLESVPHIKCQKIWFQVSGFRFQVSGFRFQVSLDVQVSSAEQLGMPVIRGGAETRARSEAFQHYIENRRSS